MSILKYVNQAMLQTAKDSNYDVMLYQHSDGETLRIYPDITKYYVILKFFSKPTFIIKKVDNCIKIQYVYMIIRKDGIEDFRFVTYSLPYEDFVSGKLLNISMAFYPYQTPMDHTNYTKCTGEFLPSMYWLAAMYDNHNKKMRDRDFGLRLHIDYEVIPELVLAPAV